MFRTRTFQRLEFDFFMRLDTDLFFVGLPEEDPFRLMAQHGCVIVYDRLSREAPGCFDGFDERTLELIHRLRYAGGVDLDVTHIGRGPAAAGGQWTIGDARLFRSDEYLQFADWVASGIYTGRWADQLILMRGVALFGPRSGIAANNGGRNATEPVAPMSICVRSLFAPGAEAGFVHQKGGFRDPRLLRVCGATTALGTRTIHAENMSSAVLGPGNP